MMVHWSQFRKTMLSSIKGLVFLDQNLHKMISTWILSKLLYSWKKVFANVHLSPSSNDTMNTSLVKWKVFFMDWVSIQPQVIIFLRSTSIHLLKIESIFEKFVIFVKKFVQIYYITSVLTFHFCILDFSMLWFLPHFYCVFFISQIHLKFYLSITNHISYISNHFFLANSPLICDFEISSLAFNVSTRLLPLWL